MSNIEITDAKLLDHLMEKFRWTRDKAQAVVIAYNKPGRIPGDLNKDADLRNLAEETGVIKVLEKWAVQHRPAYVSQFVDTLKISHVREPTTAAKPQVTHVAPRKEKRVGIPLSEVITPTPVKPKDPTKTTPAHRMIRTAATKQTEALAASDPITGLLKVIKVDNKTAEELHKAYRNPYNGKNDLCKATGVSYPMAAKAYDYFSSQHVKRDLIPQRVRM
ncbi:MAG: hypothetical protein KGH66_01020 [Candidatus Micrarchaeota archaeon]|nr:hypothetical protein [Candidatus Micrarchaeota archaeon]